MLKLSYKEMAAMDLPELNLRWCSGCLRRKTTEGVRWNGRKCNNCDRGYKKQYYKDHADYSREYRKQYRLYHPEYSKQYQLDHAYELREYREQYRQRPEVKASKSKYNRERRMNKTYTDDGTITDETLFYLRYNIQQDECYLCHVELSSLRSKDIHLDHVIPLSKGGAHSIHNVKWSCGPCNLRKNDKIYEEIEIK